MDIRECLPKTSLYVCDMTINGIVFPIYQTRKTIYIVYGNSLYGKRVDDIEHFNMRADIRRNIISEFCEDILTEKKEKYLKYCLDYLK